MSNPWRTLLSGLSFPEGPAFGPDGALWCVEFRGAGLVRWEKGRITRFAVGGAPNGIAFDSQGRLWFCDADRCAVCRLDAEGGVEVVCQRVGGETLNRPNDLVFDARGNLLFTCPGDSRADPTGYVCCLANDGRASKIAEGLFFPNGLALQPPGDVLILAETYKHRLWRGRWDPEARTWRESAVFAQAGGPIGPDGMAFDAEGRLHVAIYGQRTVKAFNESGAVDRVFPTPGANPTNVAFDPTGTLGMVVTEAERGDLLSLPDPWAGG